jgi:sodium-dependent dicarboxylate transporter 2/3/5
VTPHARAIGTVAATLLLFALMRLLPPPAGLPDAGWAVAAVGVAMAILWLSEALPLAMTATLPFLLLPIMGVMPAADVAGLYWSPTIFLVLGGALIAVAIEVHGLHRRLAIGIARRAPASPRGLLLAFMTATAITSMMVSNTATALIMMPVALALLAGDGEGIEGNSRPEGDGSGQALVEGRGFAIALVLGIAYAASIGGLGTLVGSPTNAISAGIIERALGLRIDFLTWSMFGLPLVALAVPLAALVLIALFRVPAGRLDRAAISAALGEGGALTANQKRLLPLLGLLLLGWVVLPLVKGPLGLPDIEDGGVAIAVALLLFLVPAREGGALLDWSHARRVPWDVLLLFGGGLALAGAITESGLASWIGVELQGLDGLEPWVLALVLVLVVVLVTEFASNVAAASAFMPVVAAVALQTGVAPLPLVMATAFAASWGFMMPAGTGPNAIAYGTGRVTISQMVRAGFLVDLLGVPLIVGIAFGIAALL